MTPYTLNRRCSRLFGWKKKSNSWVTGIKTLALVAISSPFLAQISSNLARKYASAFAVCGEWSMGVWEALASAVPACEGARDHNLVSGTADDGRGDHNALPWAALGPENY